MDLQVEILFFFYFFSYISYPIFWRRRATSPGVVRCSYTTPDGTRSLAGFYTNFLVAFCTTNIEDFRTPLTSTSTISSTYSSQKRSLRWTSSKRKIMEVIEVDQLKDTNNERLRWAMPHSGLKPKNEKDPKEEDDFRWKMTFDGRRSLTEDDL